MIRMHTPRRPCIECLRWVLGPPKSVRCPVCAKKYKNKLSRECNQRKRDAINNPPNDTNNTPNPSSRAMQPQRST